MKFLLFFMFFVTSIICTWLIVLLLFSISLLILRSTKIDNITRQKVLSSISKLIIRFFRIKIIIHNKHLIPKKGKLIVYSNHKTNFDPFIIASIFPRTIAFTPKDELYRGFFGWFLGFCFNCCNCIKIVRGNNRKTVENVLKQINNIQNNLVMIIFHEGGIINYNNDRIISSLDGSFKIALKSQASILPISIKGISSMRKKCWFRKKKAEIFIHPHIKFEDYRKQNTKEINNKINKIINNVL
ncbi:1-acyl-sn-glycerol-3-phosphate acyltransferase [Candidatus Phytoplasma pini]|uniref:1-acyl-sn-glycerol-3-phosphate acyltransferase n=2 Tax=Candidatus Phytoplasma pini TaxID=267362 RepID=A0A559KJY9_9MOLU|nr:1-acyl-sn-glycerol-3-phosphate acyltransferase [Candidatus Phytoplasma pini]